MVDGPLKMAHSMMWAADFKTSAVQPRFFFSFFFFFLGSLAEINK
jgi:hypothetical protein